MKIIDTVLRENYGIANTGEQSDWHERGGTRGEPLDILIASLAGIENDELISALVDVLVEGDSYWPPDGEEAFYDKEYEYHAHNQAEAEHSFRWHRFCHSILHDERFFNTHAMALLKRMFEGVHLQRSANQRTAVYKIMPGSSEARIYRARRANDESLRDKIRDNIVRELGPPPARLRTAGRLNSSGISTLYGSFDLNTCIAELRPPVGSVVAGALFEITEPLYVFDTTRFKAPPKSSNLFSIGHAERSAQYNFMRMFMREIAKPVFATDEHLDYVPTQVVAEYLANHHAFSVDGKTARIEAIIYRSAQNPRGKNIVLLGNAARVGILKSDLPVTGAKKVMGFLEDEFEPLVGGRVFRVAAKPASLQFRRIGSARFSSGAISYLNAYDDPD